MLDRISWSLYSRGQRAESSKMEGSNILHNQLIPTSQVTVSPTSFVCVTAEACIFGCHGDRGDTLYVSFEGCYHVDRGLSTSPKKELQAIKPNPLQFIPTYQFIQLINSFSVSQQQMDARLGPRPWTTLWLCRLLESDFSTPPTTELQATNRFLYGTH